MRILILTCILNVITLTVQANVPSEFSQHDLRYQTSFGSCPSRSSGILSIQVMKEFERTRSLKAVKEKFLSEKWEEKFYLSKYSVSYNPVAKKLRLDFDCPEPLARVQVYKENGREHYSAVLVNTGKLMDPSYEMVLKAEKKLKTDLPSLAIPVQLLEGEIHENFTRFASRIDPTIRNKISEIIINDNGELTVIFSLGGRATSVFMGTELWEAKLEKLTKIISYVEESGKYPSTINITNVKKVVVKF